LLVKVEISSLRGEVSNQLDLVRLVPEVVQGLVLAQHLPLKGRFGAQDLLHPLLDLLEVLVFELPGEVKIVVKTVVHRRTDCHLGSWNQVDHGFGHDVGQRMPFAKEDFFGGVVFECHAAPSFGAVSNRLAPL
jgi:hypothetical protein